MGPYRVEIDTAAGSKDGSGGFVIRKVCLLCRLAQPHYLLHTPDTVSCSVLREGYWQSTRILRDTVLQGSRRGTERQIAPLPAAR